MLTQRGRSLNLIFSAYAREYLLFICNRLCIYKD